MKKNKGLIVTDNSQKKQLKDAFLDLLNQNGYKDFKQFEKVREMSPNSIYELFRYKNFTKIDRVNELIESIDENKQCEFEGQTWRIN